MDAIKTEILEDPKAKTGKAVSVQAGNRKSAPRGPQEATEAFQNLFGEDLGLPRCEHCHLPMEHARKNQRVHRWCRTPFRRANEQAQEAAKVESRERHAINWILDNQGVISFMAGQVKEDLKLGKKKIGFRRYWENARVAFPEIDFDNCHTPWVSRHLMDTYENLQGVFRTRGRE